MARPEGDLVCLGVIGAPHGVRGDVRIRTFTAAPERIAAYGRLVDDTGRLWRLRLKGAYKSGVLAALDGINDRDAAAALTGQRLYVERRELPEIEEEETYYHTDLIGLEAHLPDGKRIGTIVAVQDYGAGDLLEVALANRGTVLIPFTAEAVPEVDLDAGSVIVAPRAEFEDPTEAEER